MVTTTDSTCVIVALKFCKTCVAVKFIDDDVDPAAGRKYLPLAFLTWSTSDM